jgi:hypothetical protein
MFIEHIEKQKEGQSRFLGYGDICQSSVCMNQEIEIKHLEASDLPIAATSCAGI